MLCEFGYDLVVNVLGGIFGGVLILWLFERNRRPDLFMKPYNPCHPKESDYGVSVKRDLSIEVHNRDTPRFVRWFFDRQPAYQCRAWLTFHRCDRSLLLPEAFVARWTDAYKPSFVDGKIAGEQRAFDIPVDEYARVDIVARLEDDEECYVWNSESFRGPEAFKCAKRRLCKGRHVVRLQVKTAGRQWFEIFWLRNDGAYGDFGLEPVDEDDPLRRIPLNRWPRP